MTKHIRLFCAGGLSTGLLVKNMKKACQEDGLDYDVSAHGVGSAENVGQDADVILVGPQVRYKMKELKKMYPNKPIELIQPQDYGLLNGKAVVQQVKNILKENGGKYE